MDVRTVTFLLNSLDQQLHFTERDVIDALDVLFDNNRDEDIDFDEFLYQLTLLHAVSLAGFVFSGTRGLGLTTAERPRDALCQLKPCQLLHSCTKQTTFVKKVKKVK